MTLRRRRQWGGILLHSPGHRPGGGIHRYPYRTGGLLLVTSWNGVVSTWIGPSTWTQASTTQTMDRTRDNAKLLIAVPFALALPLCIAVLLHQRVAGWKIFRSIYFLPTAISWVVLGLVAERFFAFQGNAQLDHPLLRFFSHQHELARL